MKLTKHHGLGNDFLVALGAQTGDPAVARAVCHRTRGIGADGLIYGIAHGDRVRMVLFNADGSPAEMSGNGIRCFAQAIAMQQRRRNVELAIETAAGVRVVQVTEGPDTLTAMVRVAMGSVKPGPDLAAAALDEAVPGARRMETGDIGNPHWVIHVDDPRAIDLASVGPRLERHVPGGVNIEFVAPRSRHELDLVVWERGAGVTEACGTGACVAAQRAHEWGLVERDVTVHMPGGEARVELEGDEVILTGPSVYIATIEVA